MMFLLTPVFCLIMILEFDNSVKQAPPQAPVPKPINPTRPTRPSEPAPKPLKPRPGSQVVWTDWKPQRNESNASWGVYLTDIVNHLPWSFGNQYRHPNDLNIWAHETSHGISSHISNTLNTSGRDIYYFYLGKDKAAGIKQPKIKISQIANLVPEKLQKGRFNLYFVKQREGFEDDPIYLYDEWVAYCNGAECGIELHPKKLYLPNKTDEVWGVLEFTVYAGYTLIAQKKHDPNYNNKQLLEFTAWNMERAMKLYHEGYQYEVFNWDEHKYLEFLRNDSAASEFRTFIIDTYGTDWAKEVFGFIKK